MPQARLLTDSWPLTKRMCRRKPPAPPKKKGLSPEEIQNRSGAAEERCKSREAEVPRQLSEKREHEKEVLQKATEQNDVRMVAGEELTRKTGASKEEREVQVAARPELCERRTSALSKCVRTQGPKALLTRLRPTRSFRELAFSPPLPKHPKAVLASVTLPLPS